MRVGLLLLAGLALAGCAERWQKPGATEAEFRAMEAQCTAHANDRWPPMLRQEMMMPPRYVPRFFLVFSWRKSFPCTLTSTSFARAPQPLPAKVPLYVLVDDHDRPRRQERRACYIGNGWMPVED